MNNNYKITPEGTRDLLFEECTAKNKVANIFKDIFESKGYHQVYTSGLEFLDTFSVARSGIAPENMYKMTDNKGRLLVVRPDSTLPIARMASTRLQKELAPIRLFYNQPIYRNNSSLNGRRHEVHQTGIELLGASGLRADLEVIVTAIESLQKIVPDFRLELGNAIFFKSLVNKLNVSELVAEDLRVSIESKNYSALNMLLDRLKPSSIVESLRVLPRLFGGEEVFEKAEKLFVDKDTQDALDSLKTIYKTLKPICKEDSLIIDLGLVQRNNYYSDIIFSGYVEGSGEAILIGGRYDKLFDCFGESMPAAGFGINVDELAKILLQNNLVEYSHVPEILVHGDDGYAIKAIAKAKFYSKSGISSECSVFDNREDALDYARKKEIEKVCFVCDSVEIVEL